METTLRGQIRTGRGKGPARQARFSGQVPAVLYGRGIEPIPLLVDGREMVRSLHTGAGMNVLINLEVAGKRYLTLAREIQRHPVRGDLLHVDFVNVSRDVKIHADVPVHLTGEAHGVKEGGVLEHHLWELRIEALPTELPSAIEVAVSGLGVGEHFRVGDVAAPGGVEILNSPEEIIVSVVEPQVMPTTIEAGTGEEAGGQAGESGPETPR
ncbi:MAG: 50S ribosomal protein L25 [Actinomycetota bacterium]